MILLDTNIVSEFMGRRNNPSVQAWLNEQQLDWLFFSTIGVGEIVYGLEKLGQTQRRRDLERDFKAFVTMCLQDRILPFDEAAAHEWGRLRVAVRQIDREPKFADSQLAAIALSKGFTIATRDLKDFQGLGVPLINPFDHQP